MVRLDDGRLAVVGSGDNSNTIEVQLFNADFSATTPATVITVADPPFIVGTPHIAALSSGGYALGWRDDNPSLTPTTSQVWGQAFGADSTPLAAFEVGGTRLTALGISALVDDSLLYYWKNYDPANLTLQSDVVYHVTTTGTLLGSATLSTTTSLSQPSSFSGAVGLAGGGIATAETLYQANGDGTWDTDLMVRVLDQNLAVQRQTLAFDGVLGHDDAITTDIGYDLEALADGGFVLEYTDRRYDTTTSAYDYEEHIVFYNADGTTRGGDILLASAPGYSLANPKLGILSSGNVVAIWEDEKGGVGLSSSHIYGQLFDPQGDKIGQQFTVADAKVAFGGSGRVSPVGVIWTAARGATSTAWTRRIPCTTAAAAAQTRSSPRSPSPCPPPAASSS
jgi:hypothetical protein